MPMREAARKRAHPPLFALGEFAARAGDLSSPIRIYRLTDDGADAVVWEGPANALPPMAFGTPVYLWAVAEDGKTLELFI